MDCGKIPLFSLPFSRRYKIVTPMSSESVIWVAQINAMDWGLGREGAGGGTCSLPPALDASLSQSDLRQASNVCKNIKTQNAK